MNKKQLNEKMEQIVRVCLDDTYQKILFYFKENFHSKDETILDVINHLLKRESIVHLLGSDEIRKAIEDPETAGFYDQIKKAKYVIEEELPEVLEMHKKPKSSKKREKTKYPTETKADKQRKQKAEVMAEAKREDRLRRKREAREEREEIAKPSAARKDKPVKQPLSEKTEEQLIEDIERYITDNRVDLSNLNSIMDFIYYSRTDRKNGNEIAISAVKKILSQINIDELKDYALDFITGTDEQDPIIKTALLELRTDLLPSMYTEAEITKFSEFSEYVDSVGK